MKWCEYGPIASGKDRYFLHEVKQFLTLKSHLKMPIEQRILDTHTRKQQSLATTDV
jgi:hypothetical protein